MNEYHVCGVLLMSRPEHSARVEHALSAIPGVELHANDGGRMVVTVEVPSMAVVATSSRSLQHSTAWPLPLSYITRSTTNPCRRSPYNETVTP